MAKMNWVTSAVILQKIFKVLHNDEGVIISLHKPLKVFKVVFVDIFEALLGLAPQPLPPLLDLELDGAQLAVLLGAHEEQLVAVATPSVLHVYCLKIMINHTVEIINKKIFLL